MPCDSELKRNLGLEDLWQKLVGLGRETAALSQVVLASAPAALLPSDGLEHFVGRNAFFNSIGADLDHNLIIALDQNQVGLAFLQRLVGNFAQTGARQALA